MAKARTITADQYRLQQGGDFDEAWIMTDSNRVRLTICDVDRELWKFGMVLLDTSRGPMPAKRDREIFVR